MKDQKQFKNDPIIRMESQFPYTIQIVEGDATDLSRRCTSGNTVICHCDGTSRRVQDCLYNSTEMISARFQDGGIGGGNSILEVLAKNTPQAQMNMFCATAGVARIQKIMKPSN